MKYLRFSLLLSLILFPIGLPVAFAVGMSVASVYLIILTLLDIGFGIMAWHITRPKKQVLVLLLPLFVLAVIALIFRSPISAGPAFTYIMIVELREEGKIKSNDLFPKTILEAICAMLTVMIVIGILGCIAYAPAIIWKLFFP